MTATSQLAPPPAFQPLDFFEPGTMCGPYEIVALIGAGGYAQVYKAVDEHDEPVALKVLSMRLSHDRKAAQRLFREAQVLKELHHEHVVEFRAWGLVEDERLAWLAMEYVEGENLEVILHREGKLDPARVVYLGQQVCAALTAVHEANLVHRDLKPANLMVGPNDHLTLVDFGIVRDEVGIGTTTTIGTPLYQAPDYLKAGPSGAIDPRWDLYSLTLVLYESLSGRHPLLQDGERMPSTYSMVWRHLKWEIPPIPGLPEDLNFVLERGLSKDPEERWQNAAALGTALARCAERLAPTSVHAPETAPKAHAATAPLELSPRAAGPRGPIASTVPMSDPAAAKAATAEAEASAPAEVAPNPGIAAPDGRTTGMLDLEAFIAEVNAGRLQEDDIDAFVRRAETASGVDASRVKDVSVEARSAEKVADPTAPLPKGYSHLMRAPGDRVKMVDVDPTASFPDGYRHLAQAPVIGSANSPAARLSRGAWWWSVAPILLAGLAVLVVAALVYVAITGSGVR